MPKWFFNLFFSLCRWYQLKCKPGQNKNDYRGELEVRTAFTVKAVDTRDSDKLGSTAEISSKAKQGSLISLNKVSERMNCEPSQKYCLHLQIWWSSGLFWKGQKELKKLPLVLKLLSLLFSKCQHKWEIFFSNSVAFSEYLNLCTKVFCQNTGILS